MLEKRIPRAHQAVLVTGGAGFIGSHVIDQLLAAGHEAAALDDLSSGSPANLPAGVKLYEVDVRDAAAVQKTVAEFRPEAIAHQAAQMSVSRSVREPRFDAEVNVLGLINTLDAAVANGVKRFVFASMRGTVLQKHRPIPSSSPDRKRKWLSAERLTASPVSACPNRMP